jgi:uncharacterized protein (DUF952 family)
VDEAEVYHIVPREDWEAAQAKGEYRPASVDAQGFVHCSTRAQVVQTANDNSRGEDGLVLLCIDTVTLASVLRYEQGDMPEHNPQEHELFPHIYGPLSLEAVTRVLPFPCRADGSFSLPPELAGSSRANPVLQATQMTEETAQKLLRFVENTEPVRRLRGSQIASALLGAVGFALFVVGVESAAQDFPIVDNPYGSIGVGLLLLLATGLLLRKLAGNE